MYKKYFKRMLDVILSLLALLGLCPIMFIIAAAVWLELGRPVLFRQRRTGKNGKVFTILKFRTMTDSRDEQGVQLSEELRLTPLGRFLRSSGFDELPELLNILKGEMSVIGPRSLPPEYQPYYTPEESARHLVRGGLIPPEVLYGDITPTWEAQLEYEADYAAAVSFTLDARIALNTLEGLIKRKRSDYGGLRRRPLSEERAADQAYLGPENGE